MPSPPILEFDALLAPIAGANPAGEPMPFAVRKQLDDARKEIDPKAFRADDPRRPEQPKPADWPTIEQVTCETLTRTSKDLQVAARLTEALVKRHGFGGLRDGLRLLRRLVQECWDRIYPAIEDGDVEPRAGAFNWLDDEVYGARFPNTLRVVALTEGAEDLKYGLQQWKDAQESRGPVTAEAFDRAVAATPREYCQTVVEDLAESVVELNELTEALTATMGELAPGLALVRNAVVECHDLAQHILKLKGPAPAPAQAEAAQSADAGAPAQSNGAVVVQRPLTRDDLLARLSDASALLLQLEPQSPIAYMIQRAVKLARMPLPDLMKVLIRDVNVLGQLDRDLDLGLEKQDGA